MRENQTAMIARNYDTVEGVPIYFLSMLLKFIFNSQVSTYQYKKFNIPLSVRCIFLFFLHSILNQTKKIRKEIVFYSSLTREIIKRPPSLKKMGVLLIVDNSAEKYYNLVLSKSQALNVCIFKLRKYCRLQFFFCIHSFQILEIAYEENDSNQEAIIQDIHSRLEKIQNYQLKNDLFCYFMNYSDESNGNPHEIPSLMAVSLT